MSTEPLTRTAPSILVNGQQLRWQGLLLGIRIERGLNIIGRATLRFVDTGHAVTTSDAFRVGAEVVINEYDGEPLFSGKVTGLDLEHVMHGPPELRIIADDHGHPLATSANIRTHLNKTSIDIAKELAAGVGLGFSGPTSQHPAHPYLLQAGGDLAFLDHLAARAGCVWWVADKKLVLRPVGHSDGTVKMEFGKTLESFSVHATSLTPTQVEVLGIEPGWAPSEIVGCAGTKAEPESRLVRDHRSAGPQRTDVLRDASPQDVQEAERLAKFRHARNQSEAVVARGQGPVDGRLRPAVTVEVSGVGVANGGYLVTEVEHVYDPTGFTTRFTAGPLRPSGLVDLVTERPDDGHKIDGVLLAVVTAIDRPDIVGRVKVRYTTMHGTVESPWAKVISPGAGKNSGVQFLPEVEDLVLVAFEQGDTRRPVVLGGVIGPDHHPASGGSKPPIAPLKKDGEAKVAYRRMTSRVGHYVELADGEKPAERHVLLEVNNQKARIRIGEDRIDVVTDGLPIGLDNGKGAKFELAANGDVTIDAENLTLQAKKSIKLKETGGTEVELGPQGLKAKGKTVEVKATATGTVEASILNLKGSGGVNIN